jgi:hypothetical protein
MTLNDDAVAFESTEAGDRTIVDFDRRTLRAGDRLTYAWGAE